MFRQSSTCISCRDLINFLVFKEIVVVGLEKSGRKKEILTSLCIILLFIRAEEFLYRALRFSLQCHEERKV